VFVLLLLGRKKCRLGCYQRNAAKRRVPVDLHKKRREGNPAYMRLHVLIFISYPVGFPPAQAAMQEVGGTHGTSGLHTLEGTSSHTEDYLRHIVIR
jgi:hypothetical protein